MTIQWWAGNGEAKLTISKTSKGDKRSGIRCTNFTSEGEKSTTRRMCIRLSGINYPETEPNIFKEFLNNIWF
jgi:hypothetical protein